MKMFISHKQEDTAIARAIANKLNSLGKDYYLDALDSTICGSGKRLTDHIKTALNGCTDIIVVMTERTKRSQWVFFEVGMATQVGLPISTYLAQNVVLPDFLDYWPQLRRLQDLSTYVQTKSEIILESTQFSKAYGIDLNEVSNRQQSIDEFYNALKMKL